MNHLKEISNTHTHTHLEGTKTKLNALVIIFTVFGAATHRFVNKILPLSSKVLPLTVQIQVALLSMLLILLSQMRLIIIQEGELMFSLLGRQFVFKREQLRCRKSMNLRNILHCRHHGLTT